MRRGVLAAPPTGAYIADMHTFRIVNVFTIDGDRFTAVARFGHHLLRQFDIAWPGQHIEADVGRHRLAVGEIPAGHVAKFGLLSDHRGDKRFLVERRH